MSGIIHNAKQETHAQNDEMHKAEHFLLTKKYFFVYNKNINLFGTEGR